MGVGMPKPERRAFEYGLDADGWRLRVEPGRWRVELDAEGRPRHVPDPDRSSEADGVRAWVEEGTWERQEGQADAWRGEVVITAEARDRGLAAAHALHGYIHVLRDRLWPRGWFVRGPGGGPAPWEVAGPDGGGSVAAPPRASAELEAVPLQTAEVERRRAALWMDEAARFHRDAEYWRQRCARLERDADVRGRAERRALELWESEHGADVPWPDGGDLVRWLLEQIEARAREPRAWEAVLYFAAWLTTREDVAGPWSARHHAGEAAKLVERFCVAQGWHRPRDRGAPSWITPVEPSSDPAQIAGAPERVMIAEPSGPVDAAVTAGAVHEWAEEPLEPGEPRCGTCGRGVARLVPVAQVRLEPCGHVEAAAGTWAAPLPTPVVAPSAAPNVALAVSWPLRYAIAALGEEPPAPDEPGEVVAPEAAGVDFGPDAARRALERVASGALEAAPAAEKVDHPAHYGGDTVYEVIKVLEAWRLGFHAGNAVKYLARAGRKPGVPAAEDLRKARWYVDRLLGLEPAEDPAYEYGPELERALRAALGVEDLAGEERAAALDLLEELDVARAVEREEA